MKVNWIRAAVEQIVEDFPITDICDRDFFINTVEYLIRQHSEDDETYAALRAENANLKKEIQEAVVIIEKAERFVYAEHGPNEILISDDDSWLQRNKETKP